MQKLMHSPGRAAKAWGQVTSSSTPNHCLGITECWLLPTPCSGGWERLRAPFPGQRSLLVPHNHTQQSPAMLLA